MIVDISDFRLGKAGHMGILTCNPAKEDLAARAAAEFGVQSGFFGERCRADLYIDAIGMKVAIDNFTGLACREATLGIVGVHHEPVPMELLNLCYNNWKIVGCGSLPIEAAMVDILAMMRSGRYDLASLVTHEFKVDQIEEALLLGQRSGEAQKICISF
jgi:threonine dehydrogenase-like Zn-dependent dehydrogenase